jgi:hypothetical protein
VQGWEHLTRALNRSVMPAMWHGRGGSQQGPELNLSHRPNCCDPAPLKSSQPWARLRQPVGADEPAAVDGPATGMNRLQHQNQGAWCKTRPLQ